MRREPWTDRENDLVVADYFVMLAHESEGHPYSKAERVRELQNELNDRSYDAVRRKRENISAVLRRMGRKWIPGCVPSSNYQESLADAVMRWLARNPSWLDRTQSPQSVAGLRELPRLVDSILDRVSKSGAIGAKSNPRRDAPNRAELSELLIRKWYEQKERCALCGGKLGAEDKPMLQPSADRIDSANGAYDDANVQITHLACNLAKNQYSVEEFEEWLSVVRDG